MPLAKHDDMIKTFASDRADQPCCGQNTLTVAGGRFSASSRLFDLKGNARMASKVKSRAKLTNADRWFLVQVLGGSRQSLRSSRSSSLRRWSRWRRAGFRRYWRWKSGRQVGRPKVQAELRALIRRMSVENPLWGAPRGQRSVVYTVNCSWRWAPASTNAQLSWISKSGRSFSSKIAMSAC